MSESLIISTGTKREKYENILSQISVLIAGEEDLIANMANISAALKAQFGWWYVGFYRVISDELVLGPFQGPVACTRIRKGRGVCGTAWIEERTIMVDDVNRFPGHIACSADSKSEIVIPLLKNGKVFAVLDIDDDRFASFDKTDKKFLEQIARLLC